MSTVERPPLSDVERSILATQETNIERGGQQINAALACIREQRLYRETHPTFEDYCQERWGMTRSTANRRILAIEVSTVLEPMGAKVNSRQARALSGLDPEEQRATYQRAREQSGSEQPTAAQIKAARPHSPGVETHQREDRSAPGPDSDAPSPAPDADRIAEAIAEFPDLAYYADAGRTDDVRRLATALREYAEPERSMRVDNLRKAIAAERRRATEPPAERGPDYRKLADQIFVACNQASGVASQNGGVDTIAAALDSGVLPIESDNWHDEFTDLARVCEQMAKACRPSLRRVK